MRFQVPQFVDIEDRIVGPLTLKQFGVYAIGFMMMVIVYPFVNVAGLVAIGLPVAGLVVLFAHVRVAGLSFGATVAHFISFLSSARLYLWRRGDSERLPISGPEYAGVMAEPEGASALSLLAQALTTAGGVVTEDKDDPIAPLEAGGGQSELKRREELRRASVAETRKSEGGE